MDHPGCFILLFLGTFHVVKEDKNWTEAQQYCKEEFTDLATIDNMREMKILNSTMNEAGGNSTHPYVLVIDTNKNWADAQRYCIEKHTDLASVRNQTENEKIQAILGSYTIAWIGLFRDAWEWSDGSTSSFRHWSPDKLVLVHQKETWKEALQYCRERHVDLVSVTSERIQRWVKERAKEASSTHVWMGLRHSCNLGFWFWVNGETVCYSNWAPGGETEPDCTDGLEHQSARVGAVKSGIDGKGEWVMLPQTEKLNFICTTEAYMSIVTVVCVMSRKDLLFRPDSSS
ncbi:secretory phospholipase A2 receptor-like [Clupea harengus]|uniref:Secretory phospholipase A2 receptor-like n=1 Tax=Clupea harengus TaxID=7950 RepID=A0A6P8GRX3_CLUHA|nr:secretory phospholipase A2 receptor-like [Clupea harengus]